MSARDDAVTGAVWAALHENSTVFDAPLFNAALRAAGYVVERDWQDISTAPRDGTWILLCGGRTDEDFYLRDEPEAQSRIVSAFWLLSPRGDGDGEEWSVGFWDGSWRTGYENPTHWMPLPAPPSVLGKQEGEG